MKYIKAIPSFILYIIYDIITTDKRLEYEKALQIGHDVICSKRKSDLLGEDIIYYYDRSKPPTRRYLNWVEYWKLRGFYKDKPKKESVIFNK
jgi:hypothetical protein